LRANFEGFGARDFSLSGVPIFDEDETFIGYRGATADVTRQIRAEDQLRHSQKMDAVGQLTGGVAHEFNNLLLTIVGNLETIAKKTPDESLRQAAHAAMDGAMRGSKLTRQLLAFSRKQTLDVKPVDTNQLLFELRDMLQSVLGATIAINTEFGDDIWPILADADQIESAMMNLSLNARDAMPKGGTITITTANETRKLVSETGEKDFVMIEVSDTGVGMTAEVIEQAIDPFFTTKDVGAGTGLGLSMVYGFLQQSGGSVEIESKLGEGTHVKMYLPRASDEAAELSVAAHQEPRRRVRQRDVDNQKIEGNILVVEDDPMVRKAVVQMLDDLGCQTVEAEDGETAMARLAEHPEINLLFTDIVLPTGISGIDVANKARQIFPNLRVLLSSGYPKKGIKENMPEAEDIWFIEKPYRAEELSRTLAGILENMGSARG
jgi:signal transduction histidine kinase